MVDAEDVGFGHNPYMWEASNSVEETLHATGCRRQGDTVEGTSLPSNEYTLCDSLFPGQRHLLTSLS